jgi:hypothetical protein
LINHARFFFYADDSEAAHDGENRDDLSTRPRSAIFRWFHSRYLRFKSAWAHPESGAMLWMRRSWDWLHSWAHPDEAMLARLWLAPRVDLHHPAARPGSEVITIWNDYLRQQRRRHLVWFSLNGIISPFAFWLFILPGPNLIGYWFAYRTIHHLLVVWGIRRVQRNKIPTALYPVAALDLPIERAGDGKVGHVALTGLAMRLDEHVAWHSSSRGARVEGKPAGTTTPAEPQPANCQTDKS